MGRSGVPVLRIIQRNECLVCSTLGLPLGSECTDSTGSPSQNIGHMFQPLQRPWASSVPLYASQRSASPGRWLVSLGYRFLECPGGKGSCLTTSALAQMLGFWLALGAPDPWGGSQQTGERGRVPFFFQTGLSSASELPHWLVSSLQSWGNLRLELQCRSG